MSGDELDRTIEFLLQNAARSAARLDALHEENLKEHAAFQLQLRELGDHVTVMTETLTTTLTAMNDRDARQDRRLAKLESHIERVDSRVERVDSLIERIEKIVYFHVSDPHAHGPATG